MQQVDEWTDAPQATISRMILNAAAINFVLVAAWLTAGMIFAVDLAMAATVAVGLSVVSWGCATLVLIPVWLISLGLRSGQDTAGESLHDSWLDE